MEIVRNLKPLTGEQRNEKKYNSSYPQNKSRLQSFKSTALDKKLIGKVKGGVVATDLTAF
ncbi:MAG: hypothetical protein KTR30_27665 [Saprospiraceae bacterium]|nr:hypothetical protein [Saprospiraceae bacterium]